MDAEQSWVAMLLDTPLPDTRRLQALFDDAGLGEALNGLPCVVAEETAGVDLSVLPALMRVPARSADALAPQATSATAPVPVPQLALNVDSYSSLDRCRNAGFTWFAGNYALHPPPGLGKSNAARHALVLQLLSLITHDAENRDIERLVKQDPQLSYQLLRLVNSVAVSPTQEISSFNHAITMLGRKPMQRWLQLLLYARPTDGDRSPLLPRAAMRAAFMDELFASGRQETRDHAFMAGMFSLLDVMLNEKMDKLLAPLHLSSDIHRALLERSGPLGPALRAVEAAETGEAPLADAIATAAIDADTWTRAQVAACHWAVRVSRVA